MYISDGPLARTGPAHPSGARQDGAEAHGGDQQEGPGPAWPLRRAPYE